MESDPPERQATPCIREPVGQDPASSLGRVPVQQWDPSGWDYFCDSSWIMCTPVTRAVHAARPHAAYRYNYAIAS